MRFTSLTVVAANAASALLLTAGIDASAQHRASSLSALKANQRTSHARALIRQKLLEKATRIDHASAGNADNKRRLQDDAEDGDNNNNDGEQGENNNNEAEQNQGDQNQADGNGENNEQGNEDNADQQGDQQQNDQQDAEGDQQQNDQQDAEGDQQQNDQQDAEGDQQQNDQNEQQEEQQNGQQENQQEEQQNGQQDEQQNNENEQQGEQQNDQENQQEDQANDQQDNEQQGNEEAQQEQQQEEEQQNNNNGIEDYPVAFEVQFQSCVALPAYSEQAQEIFEYDEQMANLANAGTIGVQQSFIIFDLCQADLGNPFTGNYLTNSGAGSTASASTSYRSYTSSCDGGTYMIDLASYMEIITTEYETSSGTSYDETYCEACAASYEYCNLGSVDNLVAMMENSGVEVNGETWNMVDFSLLTGNADDAILYFNNANGDGDQQQYNYTHSKVITADGQLLGGREGLSLLVSCSACASSCGDDWYNYTAPNADNGDVDEATISEWAAQLGECVQTADFFDQEGTFPLYAGWMCNLNHNMLEPVLFLDEQCTIYDFYSTYEQAVYGTDESRILESSENYVKGLFGKSYPLYQTPTPISWSDVLTNAVEVQSLGLEEVEQRYYESMESGEQQDANNNNDEDTYEYAWLQTLSENMEADQELANLYQGAIDLATCEGTNGQYYYEDADGNQNQYSGSSSLYVQQEGGGEEGNLMAPCSIFYSLAGDYSSVRLGPGTNYYSAVEDKRKSKIVWRERFKITEQGKIALIVIAALVGLIIAAIIFSRTCCQGRSFRMRRRSKSTLDSSHTDAKKLPLINVMEYESKPTVDNFDSFA